MAKDLHTETLYRETGICAIKACFNSKMYTFACLSQLFLGGDLTFMASPSIRVKTVQKTPGITNGTSAVMGQQQVKALCDISAQVQQYQQFLGKLQSPKKHVCFRGQRLCLTYVSPCVAVSFCRDVQAAARLCRHGCARSPPARWNRSGTPQSLSNSLQRTLRGS